ncbi:MAG TPA: ABC transporter ATP-binding protein [Candidatus Binatia bacterium]|nr:ABC transporter ATP-binding protein [Candidatus Binatia bacterium]
MIRIEDLHVRYQTERGEVYAVRGIDLDVKQGQFFTLLGPSGCGKTTTLRSVAGLEKPYQGEILVGDQLVLSCRRNLVVPPYKRDIGMVFQSYAIWPHLNVFENVAFPLREMKKSLSANDLRARVRKVLSLVQLEGLEDRPAPFLSGGQQQRLALARALVKGPRVLLLDEPLSNLDAKLREETRIEMRELVKRLGITTLYVTHDQLEALTMSDVIAVMDGGRIVQRGTPLEIYSAPQNRFVASFIGLSNFLEGRVKSLGAPGEVETSSGVIKCLLPDGAAAGDEVIVVIRPEDVTLNDGAAGAGENMLEGKIEAIVFMGDALECQVAVGAKQIRLKLHPSAGVAKGSSVRLKLPAVSCRAVRA